MKGETASHEDKFFTRNTMVSGQYLNFSLTNIDELVLSIN